MTLLSLYQNMNGDLLKLPVLGAIKKADALSMVLGIKFPLFQNPRMLNRILYSLAFAEECQKGNCGGYIP